ncbi:hypothetical protein BTVI_99219 [Pitangus sulphuratus]|nr:hypothetical protein BTVI_99219 [Pitangus sulphuratus]
MSKLLTWLGFSPGNNHCTIDGTAEMLLICTNGQAEKESVGVSAQFGVSVGALRTELLQCEAERWHITSAHSAESTFPSGFCIPALELGVLPGISAVPHSCSLFTAKFSVEIPAGKAYGRLKNVTGSNEKIHEASGMLPLAWTNVWF